MVDLVLLLTDTKHDRALGEDLLVGSLSVGLCGTEDFERLAEPGSAITDKRRAALDGLDVVRKDVKARGGHRADGLLALASKVRREGLDEDLGRLLLDLGDRRGNVRGAAVGEVVAVDGRQDNVSETPTRDRLGRVLGLVDVQRRGLARRLDRAEAAATGALVTHDLSGSVTT